MENFLQHCLCLKLPKRPKVAELINHSLFTSLKLVPKPFKIQPTSFPPIDYNISELVIPTRSQALQDTKADLDSPYCFTKSDHLSSRRLDEVYTLWKLAGGDVHTELKKQGLIKPRPPIFTLPQ